MKTAKVAKAGASKHVLYLIWHSARWEKCNWMAYTGMIDLIVRTQEPFSRVMQLQMKSAYADAMDMSDLAGDLSFQNDPQSWVNIQVQDNETFKANI